MPKIILLLAFVAFALQGYAQCPAPFLEFEDFENNSAATPPAGWIAKNVEINTTANASFPAYSGDRRAGLNDKDDSLIVRPLTCPGELSFYWRSSGTSSSWAVSIEWSNNLNTWTAIDSVVVGNPITNTGNGMAPVTYQQKIVNIPEGNFVAPFNPIYIRFRMYRRISVGTPTLGSGTCYIDDVCIKPGTCIVPASELRFTAMPSNCIEKNIPFSVTVCATDGNGYIADTFSRPITISLASGPGSLSGTLTANASGGCVTFNNIIASDAGLITLQASGGMLAAGTSTSIDVKSICPNVDTLKIVTYNLLNFPLGGVYALGPLCSPQELGPNRWDTLKYILQYIKPDVLIVQELQTKIGSDSVLERSLNADGITYYGAATYIPNQSTANTKYNNMCYYNTNKLGLLQTTTIGTDLRDCGVYKFYCKDPKLNLHNDTAFLDVYSMHTKAKGQGTEVADSLARDRDTKLVMDTIRLRQSGMRNAVLGGDLNLYTSAEGAFINLTSGQYKFNDPANQPGPWESNVTFAPMHSQAARAQALPSLECGARGGLDSRLDFLLATDPIMTGTQKMEYIPNSYWAFGNSGNLFNKSVNDVTNTSGVPALVLRKLINMSDHVPVEIKIKVSYPILAPIENLIYFNGIVQQQNALLSWKVDNAPAIKNFTIQKLINGQYQNIGTVLAQPALNNYQFLAPSLQFGNNFYRLKVTEQNNTAYFSQPIKLNYGTAQFIQVYPNPFTQQINITGITGASLVLRNNLGQQVWQAAQTASPAVMLPSNLAPGLYWLQVQKNNTVQSFKIFKQ
jgi:hypothetical protein